MNTEQPPKVQICANRFELISRWGQPVDKAWARAQLDLWLAQRVDLEQASDYDQGVQTKGDAHDQPD